MARGKLGVAFQRRTQSSNVVSRIYTADTLDRLARVAWRCEAVRYCVGCIHWRIYAHERGQVYSEHSADSDTPAHLACEKGHWTAELSDYDNQEDIQAVVEECMEKAEKCPDFEERLPAEPPPVVLPRDWLKTDAATEAKP